MTVRLLAASDMGARPKDFYAVATAPGLLAGMSYPRSNLWSSLHVADYRWVVCLTDDTVPYDPAPLAVLYAARLQDQAGRIVPDRSDHEERCIREAVSLIYPRVCAGEGVAVHCAGGYWPNRHRDSLLPQGPGFAPKPDSGSHEHRECSA